MIGEQFRADPEPTLEHLIHSASARELHVVARKTGSMKVLLLIPHKLDDHRHEATRKGDRPQADYDALAEALRRMPGGQADILDWNSVVRDRGWLVQVVRRLCGLKWALAVLGYQRCRQYDAVFSHSEIVGLPFAMLISTLSPRPRHVTTAYYLFGKRNVLWYRLLRVQRNIDKIFTLALGQYKTGREQLRLSDSKLVHVDACGYVDTKFFSSCAVQNVNERQICSVGLEFRDYGTLLKAVAELPDVKLKIDPSSPWSLHHSELGHLKVPPNVEICHMELGSVRRLYAESAVVVIPLRDNPIGAGTTTLVEVMSMGKPAIVTKSKDNSFAGRRGIVDGDNVVMVDVGDVGGLRCAIDLLIGNQELRERIGANARNWANKHAGREQWANIVIGALSGRTETSSR
jgi:glycosyltransferase involved in cell wall biosynthesis